MCQTRHYLGFHVLLDHFPLLPILRCRRGQQRPQVSRLHIRKHASLLDSFEVINDWDVVIEAGGCGGIDLLWSMAECAALLNSSEFMMLAVIKEECREKQGGPHNGDDRRIQLAVRSEMAAQNAFQIHGSNIDINGSRFLLGSMQACVHASIIQIHSVHVDNILSKLQCR